MKYLIAVWMCFLTFETLSQDISMVRGEKEIFEKKLLGKNLTSLRNTQSKFRDGGFESRSGSADEFFLPENQFLSDTFKRIFPPAELTALGDTRLILSCIFNADGILKDVAFTYPRDVEIPVSRFELIECGLVDKYRIRISRVSPPDAKFVAVAIPVRLREVSAGEYKF